MVELVSELIREILISFVKTEFNFPVIVNFGDRIGFFLRYMGAETWFNFSLTPSSHII